MDQNKWINPGKRVAPTLHSGVIAIEKGAFGSPSTTVAQLTKHQKVQVILSVERRNDRGVVCNVQDSDIVVNMFKLQFRSYVQFQINTLKKGMKILIPLPSNGLNSTAAIYPQV